MVKDLALFAEQEPYWGLLITPHSVNHTMQGWATAERMIEDMDAAGLDKVVLMGEYRLRHEACVARNDQSLHIIGKWPDRVIAFAVVQPKAGEKALDEAARCLDSGMKGIGELSPYGAGYTLNDPDFLRVVELCIDRDVPLNLHVSEEIGHYYLGKSTTPLLHYYELACRYPELKLILSHWGGGLIFYEIMPEVRRKLSNVWYDTAGSPLLYPTEAVFGAALHCIDHRKLIYGSDYPLLICREKQCEPDFRPFVDEINALGLSDEVYDGVMGNNAARLLGLAEDTIVPEVTAKTQVESRADVGLDIPDGVVEITPMMAVSTVARVWPQTRRVFRDYGIPWEDSPVPFWEPIVQAAAARGYGQKDRRRLLDELNEALN
jgi:predicted TIM-barrel fold metal-dependent hydrolase